MLDTQYTIQEDLTNGTQGSFIDTTVYGGSNPNYSDILRTRFLFGNIMGSQYPQNLQYTEPLEQYRQYKSLTLEGFTYDGKLIPINGLLVPQITSLTVQENNVMQDSGIYVKPTTYLPTADYTIKYFDHTDLGIELIAGKIPDMVYSLTYETYIAAASGTNVEANKQYMVYSGTVSYNGNSYRTNEVFIADDNGAYSGGVLVELAGIRFSYFQFTYNIQRRLAELQFWIHKNGIQDPDLMYRITVMYAKLKSVQFSSLQNFTSASTAQEIINDISSELNVIYADKNI